MRDEALRELARPELARPKPRRTLFARLGLREGSIDRVPFDRDAVSNAVSDVESDVGLDADHMTSVVRRVGSDHTAPGALRGAWSALPSWLSPSWLSASWLSAVAVVIVLVLGVGIWSVLRRSPGVVASLPHAAVDVDSAAPATTSTLLESKSAGAAKSGRTGEDPASAMVTVHVAGAVVRPGVVSLRSGSRAVDAVQAAGGLVVGADADRVNLAAPLIDGERLVVPLLGQPVPAEVQPQVPRAGGAGKGSGSGGVGGRDAASGVLDINVASVEELDALPGIGPATAQAIVAHRDEQGPFAAVDDLLDVRGIGEAKLAALRDLVTVGP